MQTLQNPVSVTYEIKQSKFIAHLVPYHAFETYLERLKSEHPKARHFVTAFRYLNTYGQIVEGSRDDGEPKGTSGKPSLAVLAGHDLIDAGAIVVRYFGGTKLGTGGLVRAYTKAVGDVVEAAQMELYVPMITAVFRSSYSDVGRVEYALEQCGITRMNKSFEAQEVLWEIEAPEESIEAFYTSMGRRVTFA